VYNIKRKCTDNITIQIRGGKWRARELLIAIIQVVEMCCVQIKQFLGLILRVCQYKWLSCQLSDQYNHSPSLDSPSWSTKLREVSLSVSSADKGDMPSFDQTTRRPTFFLCAELQQSNLHTKIFDCLLNSIPYYPKYRSFCKGKEGTTNAKTTKARNMEHVPF
jgi:hypothetical protein